MYKHGNHVCRVIIKQDLVFSCSRDNKVKAWSIPDKKLKYQVSCGNSVIDMVIGREGTPLENRILAIGADQFFRVLDLKTGAIIAKKRFGGQLWSIAVDEAQTLVAIGDGSSKVTFIETSSLMYRVKEIFLDDWAYSLAFNKRSDCMLAVTTRGDVHSFKF